MQIFWREKHLTRQSRHQVATCLSFMDWAEDYRIQENHALDAETAKASFALRNDWIAGEFLRGFLSINLFIHCAIFKILLKEKKFGAKLIVFIHFVYFLWNSVSRTRGWNNSDQVYL